MAVTLGLAPIPITVVLVSGSDFKCTLESSEDWPDGFEIELRFSITAEETDPIVWPATVDGALATWNVPADEVAAVLAARALHARVRYVEAGGGATIRMLGPVHAVA